jgi:hypothetical protein
MDQLYNSIVLFLSPWTLNELRVQNLLPPMEALHVRSVFKVLGYLLPASGAKLFN